MNAVSVAGEITYSENFKTQVTANGGVVGKMGVRGATQR